MGKMYTLDKKLLCSSPEIRIGEKVYPVDDRKNTVIKVTKLFNDSNPRVCRSDLENFLGNNCTRHLANCTTLANFVTAASLGDANVAAENAYYIPIYQYDGMGIITLNNEKYITNGYWCIKD